MQNFTHQAYCVAEILTTVYYSVLKQISIKKTSQLWREIRRTIILWSVRPFFLLHY